MNHRVMAGVIVAVLCCGFGVIASSSPQHREQLGSQNKLATAPCRLSAQASTLVGRAYLRSVRAAGRALEREYFRNREHCYLGLHAWGMRTGYLLVAPVDSHNHVGAWQASGHGCGEGPLRTLIPDWVFTTACDDHDLCYLFHHDPRTGKMQDRRDCDSHMLSRSQQACTSEYDSLIISPIRWICNTTASTYWLAVRALGARAWNDDTANSSDAQHLHRLATYRSAATPSVL